MIVDNKVSPAAGVAKKLLHGLITSVVGQTKAILDIVQLPFGFVVESVGVYCQTVTTGATFDCRLVPVVPTGGLLNAITLTVGGTASNFKINAAIIAVGPLVTSPAVVPPIVYQAITDNNAFSSAFTINVGAASGLFWGAVRIQMSTAGTITTKVVSADQAFATEAEALVACPQADAGKIDLGTITIQMKTGATFTAQTTDLNDTTVNATNYNGRAATAVSVLTGEVSFVSLEKVYGTMVAALSDAACASPGGLLVIDYTTAASTGALLNGRYDVQYRPYPMAGETLVPANPPAR